MKNLDEYYRQRPNIKTGDAIIFYGSSPLSLLLRGFQFGGPSHIGMAIRCQPGDILMLLESTSINNVADVVTGKIRNGVTLVPLSYKLRSYRGKVYHRALNKPLEVSHTDKLHEAIYVYRRKEYEKSLKQLAGAAFGWNKEKDLSTLFCSELFAQTLIDIGLLKPQPVSSTYSPKKLDPKGRMMLCDEYISEPSVPILV